MTLPDLIYVDGKPYRVLQGGLRLARDGVARDAEGRQVREPCVDPARASAWLYSGVATADEPVATGNGKKAAKTMAKKKGGA